MGQLLLIRKTYLVLWNILGQDQNCREHCYSACSKAPEINLKWFWHLKFLIVKTHAKRCGKYRCF